jgi:hypothetical protein
VTYQELRNQIEAERSAHDALKARVAEAVAECRRYNSSAVNLETHRIGDLVLKKLDDKEDT